MSDTPKNPYAFPVPKDAHMNGQEGMTLRDYFAAHATIPHGAVQDTMNMKWPERDGKHTNEQFASYEASLRYLKADAMLAERNKLT